MKKRNEIDWKQVFSWHSIAFSVVGVISAVIALKGFMIPNHFIDGGVTGVSILISEVYGIDISLLIVVLNIPFLVIGYRKIGKTFAVQGTLAILLLAIMMYFVEIPTITSEKILISVFAGFLIGLGVGLVIRGGAVIDGLEVIADYTQKKSGITTSEIILLINSILMFGAGYYFGIETAMYSILTYFTAVKTSDYVVDGVEQYTALTIISKNEDAIKSAIVNEMGKAISVYKGERGYLPGAFEQKQDCDIITTVATRLEINRIKQMVHDIDPQAFFYIHTIREVDGGVVKKVRKDH